MSHLCDLIFFFFSIFIMINCSYNLMNTDAFLEYVLLFLDDDVDEKYEYFSNSKSSSSECYLAFAYFLPILAWRWL